MPTYPSRRTFLGATAAAGALRQQKLISYSRGEINILDGKGLEAAACPCYQIVKDLHDGAQAPSVAVSIAKKTARNGIAVPKLMCATVQRKVM